MRAARGAVVARAEHLVCQLLFVAALAGCAQLPTRPSAGPIADVPVNVAAPATTALSAVFAGVAARRDTAERVWSLVDERFYDPRFNGANWSLARERFVPRAESAISDAELYAALKAMVGTLRDSHTQVLTPRETIDRRRFVAPRLGFNIGWVEGRVAITEAEPESPAAAAGLRTGDVIRSVNDTPFDEAFIRAAARDATRAPEPVVGEAAPELPAEAADAERERVLRAARRVLRVAAGTPPMSVPVRLEIERDAGLIAEATLTATMAARPPSAEFRMLDGGVALIRFTRFLPEVRGPVERALAEAAPARAIIIDLRGNSGGLLEFYRWFAGRFLPEPRDVMRSVRRDRALREAQATATVRASPGAEAPLLQPLAVLVDARTASAAELTAVTLAEQRGALLVGDPSCGCVVGVRTEYVLPDGGGLRLSETGFVSPRGARMEGRPIAPAIRAAPTLADLRAGRDVALLAAQQKLIAALSASTAAR